MVGRAYINGWGSERTRRRIEDDAPRRHGPSMTSCKPIRITAAHKASRIRPVLCIRQILHVYDDDDDDGVYDSAWLSVSSRSAAAHTDSSDGWSLDVSRLANCNLAVSTPVSVAHPRHVLGPRGRLPRRKRA